MRNRSFQFLIAAMLVFTTAAARELSGASAPVHPSRVPAAPSFLDFRIYLPITVYRDFASTTILPNDTWFISSLGSLHVVGEVSNDTRYHLGSVKVSASLLDRNGQILRTESAYTYLDFIPAGQKTCFDITFLEPPSSWDAIDLKAPNYTLDGKVLPAAPILNTSGEYVKDSGDYIISGQVRNDQGSRINGVKPVGTLYNPAEKVIGCELTYVESMNLNPGAISSFKIDFYGRNYKDVNSFRVQVDGDY
ncbi:MAG TPA: FxLYD domain-containing protein [Anaerolineales bacterium]